MFASRGDLKEAFLNDDAHRTRRSTISARSRLGSEMVAGWTAVTGVKASEMSQLFSACNLVCDKMYGNGTDISSAAD